MKKRKTGTSKQIFGLAPICILLMIIFSTPVSANLILTYNKTQNTAGQAIWNETFAGNESHTFYVNVPKNATVSNAKLNLSGYSPNNITLNDTNKGNLGDTRVQDLTPDTNDGSNPRMDIQSQGTPSSNNRRIFTLWNLTGVSNSVINAKLSLYVEYHSASGRTYNVYNTSNSWAELGITWNNQPSAGTLQDTQSPTFTDGIWYNWSVTNAAISQLSQTNKNLSIMIRDSVENAATTQSVTFDTKEMVSSVAPQLFLSFSPPVNPYLDVTNDGDSQWSFSGSFNQSNNQTSDFSSEINSYLKNCYPYTDGTCDVPFILHSDSAGKIQVQLNATITYDSETFDNPVYEGQVSNFWVKVNSTPDISNVNAWLVWNGTSYAYTTKQQSGTFWIFTKALTIPTISADSNVSFFWNFTYSNATSTYAQNFSSDNQTVYVLKLMNCTSGNITLNFTGYNENSKALMNYKMDSTIIYWPTGKPFTKNFSYSYTGNNTYYVCIAPSTATLYADADIKYWNDSYSTRYYYLQNATLTSSIQNINLYLLNSTDSALITMIVKDQVENPVGNEIVLVQRQDLGAGTYTQVSEAKSDFSGYAYTYLKLHENYKFFLTKSGIVQREFEPMQLESASLTFYVSQIDTPEYFSYYNKVATSCSNISNILTCSWIDTSGLTADMTLYVGKIDQVGETTFCEFTSSGSSGTFVCDLSSGGNFRYAMYGTYHSNPIKYLWQSGYIGGASVVDFGVVGLVLTLLIVMFVSYMTHNDVKLCLVSTAFALIFCSVISLIRFGADAMAMTFTVGIISGIVAFKIRF